MQPLPPAEQQPQPHKSKTQELYRTSDEPISSFGFANDFDKKFELEKEIGRGTFGVVYIGVERATGERCGWGNV